MTNTNGYPTIEKRIAIGIPILYVTLCYLWASLSEYSWDDDAPTRIYNCLITFQEPKHFVSLWNRPLFVLLFALPSKISIYAVHALMPIFTAFSAYLGYIGLKKKNVPGAILFLAFCLFQPYQFILSYQAYTEPLGVILICLSIHAWANDKWLRLAILGGLIPLARLELTPLLLFWVIPLIQNKAWKHLIWLVVPTVVWNIAGWIIMEDPLYLLHQTILKESNDNRYGHNEWYVYLHRYLFVIGPILFVPLLVGIFTSFMKRIYLKWTLLFLTGFFIYTLFSWKLDLGNAAGFLRNITTLSPFVAILAGMGIQSIMDTWSQEKVSKSTRIAWVLVGLGLFLVFQYFCVELNNHHTKNETFAAKNLIWASVAVIAMVSLALFRKRKGNAYACAMVIFPGLICAFTLINEPPNTSYSAERENLAKFGRLHQRSYLKDRKLFANHVWFYWSQGLNKHDGSRFEVLTKANIENAPNGTVLLWENHYSNRLSGDVASNYLAQKSKEYIELARGYSTDRASLAVLAEKAPLNEHKSIITKFYNEHPEVPEVKFAYAKYLHEKEKKHKEAIAIAKEVLETDSNIVDAYSVIGMAHYQSKEYDPAIENLKMLESKVKENPQLWYNIATILVNKKDYKSAIVYLNKAIAKNTRTPNAHYLKGVCLVNQQKMDQGLKELEKELSFNKKNANAWLLAGKLIYNKNNLQKACECWSQAQQLGNTEAMGLLNAYCSNQ